MLYEKRVIYMRNYYDILGISRDATQEEIKNAYRKLAKKYHPDSSSDEDSKERFQEIQEAYAVLSNPDKRQKYHYYGHSAYRDTFHSYDFTHTSSQEHEHCGACDGGDCSGGCSGHGENGCHVHHPHPEPDFFKHVVRISVHLEMEETFQTVTKEAVLIEYPSTPIFSASRHTAEKEWKFKVSIPANTYENQLIPLEDVICDGEELIHHLHAHYPNNLYYVIILVNDRPGYTRKNYHLYMDYTIDFHTLVLGGTIKVPGLNGELLFSVPPGTSPEQRLRFPSEGMNYPPKIGKRGDLYLNLHIRIPKQLTPEQEFAFQMVRKAFEEPTAT